MSDDIPTMYCEASEHQQWFFWCVHCRCEHVHGEGEGHRVEHCYTEAGKQAYTRGYIIKLDPEKAVRKPPPRPRARRQR